MSSESPRCPHCGDYNASIYGDPRLAEEDEELTFNCEKCGKGIRSVNEHSCDIEYFWEKDETL